MGRSEYPSGYAIYCDDVRYEIGGKTSLIGVYENDLNIYTDGPIIIPSLYVVIKFRVPVIIPASTISLRVDRSDTGETMLNINHKLESEAGLIPALSAEKKALGISQNRTLASTLTIQNLEVDSEFYLRTRGYVDDLEVKLGALIVRPVKGDPPSDLFA